ncbi:hypothetical protein [Amycolatopsis sp. cmx-11-51]
MYLGIRGWCPVKLDPKCPELLDMEHPAVARDLIASAQREVRRGP